MACAKTTVKCTIVTPDGQHIVGTNLCLNPQDVCPREVGEGYEKCKTICHQLGHAETVAAMKAGELAKGGRAYIEGHTYACKDCQETLYAAGVTAISVGITPPSEERDE